MQKILSMVRKAITDYSMITEGDKIAVGLSGGKDSLMLLNALANYRRFSPEKFDLVAIHINMNFEGSDPNTIDQLRAHVESLGVPFFVEETELGEILFNVRQEKNPCSLCAKMRRGALCEKCVEIGANKLALGHHADDVLETFLLSFLYEARLSSFAPKSLMDRTGITVIRPMLYLEECEVTGAVNRLKLPVAKNPCPKNHESQREYMKNLVKRLDHEVKDSKTRMLSAIMHPERYNLTTYKKDVE